MSQPAPTDSPTPSPPTASRPPSLLDMHTDVETDLDEPSSSSSSSHPFFSLDDDEPAPPSFLGPQREMKPAPWGAWAEDEVSKLVIRGPTFLQDKVKIPVGTPIFKLAHVDMFYTSQDNENLIHVATRPGNWAYQFLEKREQRKKEKSKAQAVGAPGGQTVPAGAAAANGSAAASSSNAEASPLFIMNFLFPGPNKKNMNLVLYFIRRVRPGEELRAQKEKQSAGSSSLSSSPNPSSSPLSSPTPLTANAYPPIDIPRVIAFDNLLRKFITGTDEFRDCRFKIIPRIADGPWMVRKGVGCVPAILGKKVKQLYFHDPVKNYFEVVADISSSMVAGRILSLVKGAATSLTIDLSFLLQGEDASELPESLLGGVRILHCNLDGLLEIEEHEKWLQEVWLKKEIEEGRW